MLATPIRRRTRRAAPLVGILLTVGLLAGCSGQKTPGSYTSGVKGDFIEGCWSTLVRDAKGTPAAKLSIDDLQAKYKSEAKVATTQCTCAYAGFKKDIKFSEFKKINDDQTETPAKLSSKVTKVYEKCGVGDSLTKES